jgi:Cys-tRNA(Pro)/Cys-tRNA(Cys) deacylase
MGKIQTRAVRALDELDIPYRVLVHAHRARNVEEAATERGVSKRQVVKSLLVCRPDQTHILALVRGDHRLSLKKLARVAGVKVLEMAPQADVPRITGYQIGAVAPLGLRRAGLPVYVDQSILEESQVTISAGRHDAGLELDARDLVRAVSGLEADITA